MSESQFPLPPQDEWDGDRHVHPYVRNPEPDASAYGFTNQAGAEWSQEDRSRESRLAFHAIEPLLDVLTPIGLVLLMQTCLYRVHPGALEKEMRERGFTPEELDPRAELVPFASMHEARLDALYEPIEEMATICPRCGRNHGPDGHDDLAPGAYVHSETGDAVRVTRVEQMRVYATAQVSDTGREVARLYDRPWFDENFVPAEGVEVLGGPIR